VTQIFNWQEVQGIMFCLHSWVLCDMRTCFISTTLIDLLKILKLKYHCILTPENTSKLADQACYQIEQSTGLGPTILSQFELISSYLEANGRLLPVVLFPVSAHLRIWNMRVCTKVLMSGGVEVPRATKDKAIAHWASNLDFLGIAQLLLSLPSLF
jgi:hypothetical protein